MGLLDAIKGGSLDLLFFNSDDLKTSREVAKAQSDLIKERAAQGRIDPATANDLQKRAAESTIDSLLQDPKNSPAKTFTDTVKTNFDKGVTAIRQTVNDTLQFAGGTIFKLLPFWVWLLIAAAAFIYFYPQIAIALKVGKKVLKK